VVLVMQKLKKMTNQEQRFSACLTTDLEGRSKSSVGSRLTPGEFGDDRCMFIE